MKQTVWLWIIALLVTLVSARYQRVTGPTEPLAGKARLGQSTIPFVLERSHAGAGDQPVTIAPGDTAIAGIVEWQHYPGPDHWRQLPMHREAGHLVGGLPHQPPAGKLAYRVLLTRGPDQVMIPAARPAVIRFRGDVPPWILIPHILFMFLAMLLSTRAGLEFFNPKPGFRRLAWWTLATLFVGGLVFGPFMLHYAFGGWWGGFPVGTDITDNKTLIAFLGWLAAALAASRLKQPKWWVAFAALLMLVVFLIPHSFGAPRFDSGKLGPQSPPPATQR